MAASQHDVSPWEESRETSSGESSSTSSGGGANSEGASCSCSINSSTAESCGLPQCGLKGRNAKAPGVSAQSKRGDDLPHRVVLRLVLFACASGLLFGIDLGSIGAALSGMSRDLGLGIAESEAIVSGCKGGAIVGGLLGGAWMTTHGRRFAVATAAVPFLVGPMMLALSNSFVVAFLGRLAMGLGVGISSVAAPCFLSEVATPSSRGILVACYELAIALGFLVASAVDLLIGWSCTGECWRYQAGVLPLVAALPLFLVASLLPESPRWLLSRAGGDAMALRHALVAMRRLGCDGAAERLAAADAVANGADATTVTWTESSNDMVALWDQQHKVAGSPLLLLPEVAAARASSMKAPTERVSVRRVLMGTISDVVAIASGSDRVPPGAAKGLFLAVSAAALDQACASTSVLVYTQHLLKEVGVESVEVQDSMAVLVSIFKFMGVLFGLALVDRIGRRTLMGGGGAVCAIALLLVSAGAASSSPVLLTIGICSFILVFVATWGGGYWVVVTEVTAAGGARYAAASQAAATTTLFTAGWLTSLTFVSVIKAGGPWGLLVYAAMAVLMAVFGFGFLPETKGLSLEACASLLAAGASGDSVHAQDAAKGDETTVAAV
eukprot:CAMPEP_0115372900 /NCGR_PEP_ID=MMETSP0271-20121206/1147_1 /TAXON_ID=71861 /ORGANISM="Scrippsiella trochoidea, Strain CCMP3099" /LENGTH=611 /DNA_ID=CAMNT_0002795871 /DNA_START=67 /DNA_END=1902 /DNA_ORIENTATION=+